MQKVTANPALVNIILKPLVQPAVDFAPVKYIIYKGVLANSLIATNGTDIAAPGNNDLTKFVWAEQAKKNASATPNTNATAPANALGNVALLAAPSLFTNLRYDTKTAFEAVGLVNNAPMVLIGRKPIPGAEPKDFVAWIKLKR